MLTVTFGDLRNPKFNVALGHLADIKALPGQVSYNIAKVLKALADEEKIVQGLFEKLADPFLEKDEKGEKVGGGRPGEFRLVPGKDQELEAAVKEFEKTEVTIDRPKTAFKLVGDFLTPRDIMLLAPLLTEPLEAK